MANLLEDVADFFEFTHEEKYRNKDLARRASELRWDVISFLEEVDFSENSD